MNEFVEKMKEVLDAKGVIVIVQKDAPIITARGKFQVGVIANYALGEFVNSLKRKNVSEDEAMELLSAMSAKAMREVYGLADRG